MRIEETKIFEFKFPFHGGEISIPVRAMTVQEAATDLKALLNNFMIDLATEFPVAIGALPTYFPAPEERASTESNIPSYALELDIETLIKELMPIKKPKGAQGIAKLVKDWTGFEYAPQNYPAILDELKKMKS